MIARNSSTDIESMHAAYVRGTGLDLPLTMQSIFTWERLWAEGVRAADVALVIGHLRRRAKAEKSARGFRFSTFIGRTDLFVEDLAEARAANRVQRPDPSRTEALAATGRPATAPLPPSRTAAAIIEKIITREEFAAELARLKEELR